MNLTSSFICRVQRPDGIHVRLEVFAKGKDEAMKYATKGLKGATVSCREKDFSEYEKPQFMPIIVTGDFA